MLPLDAAAIAKEFEGNIEVPSSSVLLSDLPFNSTHRANSCYMQPTLKPVMHGRRDDQSSPAHAQGRQTHVSSAASA